MSVWSGSPSGALLTAEERSLAAVGLVWAPFAGTYTYLCHGAGAPAVMWVGSGLITLYGLWIALLGPCWSWWTRRGERYELDGGGLRVLDARGRQRRRFVIHEVVSAWLEEGPGGTSQVWIRTRGGSVEVVFVGIQSGSEDAQVLQRLVAELNRES